MGGDNVKTKTITIVYFDGKKRKKEKRVIRTK